MKSQVVPLCCGIQSSAVSLSVLVFMMGLLTAPLFSERDPKGGAIILALQSQEAKPYEQVLEGFQEAVAKADSVEITVHLLEEESGSTVVQELSGRKPDLVLAIGKTATDVAIAAFENVPTVATMLVSSEDFDRPNITGVSLQFSASTQFEWLRRMLPESRSVGVLYDPMKNRRTVEELSRAAEESGVELKLQAIRMSKDIPPALKMISRRADVLLGVIDSTVYSGKTAQEILLFSFRNRIPLVGVSEAWAKAGALYTLERDYGDIGVQAGEIAVRILHGTPVRSIRVATPRKLLYDLNLKTAERMNLDIPKDVKEGARQLFE